MTDASCSGRRNDAADRTTARSSLNLAHGVARHGLSKPGATALVVSDRTVSYGELRSAAGRIAAWLRASGLERPRVGVLASRSMETYAGILGACWAGGTYVALNPRQPAARIASILARSGIGAVIVDAAGAAHLGDADLRAALPPFVLLAAAHDRVAATTWNDLTAPASEPVPVAPGHPAYIMFTSGTTGFPKGVVVSAGAVEHFLSVVREQYAIGPADRVGQFAEASFDMSIFEIFACWDGGASLHVVPESQLMAPASFIRREKLTVWTSVPSVIAMMSRMKLLEPGLFPTLRASFFIGEPLTVQSARAWQQAAPASVVDNQYGPTEATCACTVQRVTEPVVETEGRGTVAIGTAYPGMEADIVDDAGAFLPNGEPGELALSGPQLADGYLDDPVQTAARFPLLDHPQLGRRRWYLTGDLAYRDARGILHCLGRKDHQVKVLGNRVELEDIEANLRIASGTDAVAAVAWPLVAGSALGVAAFLSGCPLGVTEVRERLKQLVPPYMVPRQILLLDALPLSAHGKIDRAALRALLEEKG